MREKFLKIKNLCIQFLKFGIVGFSNTLISLVTYYILVYFGIHYILANTAGFLVSVCNAFYWNSKYVFKNSQETRGRAFVKVFLSYGGSFLLSTFIIFVLVDLLNISELIAPVLRLVITVPLNFVVNKLWAFADRS